MEHLIAVVIGLVGTYAVSIYFGRQTDKLIASCSSRTDALIALETQNTRDLMDRIVTSGSSRTDALIASEAQNTRDLMERLGQTVSRKRDDATR